MTEVTRILSAIEEGDVHATEQLMPLVYDELRRLATANCSKTAPCRRFSFRPSTAKIPSSPKMVVAC
jgi:hypothetical protein